LLPHEYSPPEYTGQPVSHLDLLSFFNKVCTSESFAPIRNKEQCCIYGR
jgi:hypothetical protein